MTDPRFVDRLLDQALDLPRGRRSTFLDERCPPPLRAKVERMLASCDEPGDGLGEALEGARSTLADAVVGAARRPLEAGAVAGHFVVEGELSRGSTSIVYRARDPRRPEPVALKLLAPELLGDERAKQRFLAQAKASSALDHEAICTIYDAGALPDGRLFLAMPLLRGETLAERLAELGPLPLETAVGVAARVAGGLARAHRANIIHRDIKPSNLMLIPRETAGDEDPGAGGERVKILDFGVAKLVDGPTRPGDRVGTVAYMAPEQARGGTVDARIDLWALGAVLFEMLTGRLPFERRSLVELLLALRHDEPARLRDFAPDLPPEVDAIVDRALRRDPAARWPSADAMAEALTSVGR